MKKSAYPVVIIMVAVFLLSPQKSLAKKIEHHGFSVNAEGSTLDCLSCHDGSAAGSIRSCSVKCDFSSSHSILKPYPPAQSRGSYAPLAEVKRRGIRIRGGKVTCISCHNLNNPASGHLVIESAKLCQACHLK